MKTIKVTEYQKQSAWVVATVIVAAVLGFWLIVLPGMQKLGELQRELDQVAAKRDILEKIQQQEEKIRLFKPLAIEEKDRYLVISQLTAAGNRHGLDIESLAPAAETEAQSGVYRIYRVHLNAKSDFRSLMSFLRETANLKPKIAIEKMEITQRDRELRDRQLGQQSTLLQVSMTMSVLVGGNRTSSAGERK